MKPITGLLLHLYPAAWRDRYGPEFEALLEDSGLDWRTTFDLLKGAIKMHFSIPSFPKLIGLLAAAGLVSGFAASYLLTPRYVSTTLLRYSGGADGVEQLMEAQNEILSHTSLSALMQDPALSLYAPERQARPIEDVIETMRKDIQITVAPAPSHVFSISYAYSDRAKAQATVQALVTKFVDSAFAHALNDTGGTGIEQLQQRVAELERRLNIRPALSTAPGTEHLGLQVIDPPSLPVNPVFPNRGTCAATGFISGIVLAIIVYAFRRHGNRDLPLPSPA